MMRNLPFGPDRRRREAARGALLRGGPVRQRAMLRRTSSRGWGTWTEVLLELGPLPDGAVSWSCDDPVSVGLPSTHGRVEETLTGITDAHARDIRFRTEAFWGMDGDILVLSAEPVTTELALPPATSAPTLDRLMAQLGVDDPA